MMPRMIPNLSFLLGPYFTRLCQFVWSCHVTTSAIRSPGERTNISSSLTHCPTMTGNLESSYSSHSPDICSPRPAYSSSLTEIRTV
ncbi:hypothetical protein F4819DRAFT_71594 [Hypoxylon fuscum]|nr:hypothetical protein F4819DRAFT_71594 [Hypoxylon fuscum]